MSRIINEIMDHFQNYDRNDDRDPSIVSLNFLPFEEANLEIHTNAELILVLVESRLIIDQIPETEKLIDRLARFKYDLRAEGLISCFIEAELYNGSRHQDGRTLLALRSFIREVWQTLPALHGVILVGSFPEATVVRRAIWSPNFNVSIAGIANNGMKYLSIAPEMIAARSEIILADLDGNWNALYHENWEEIESIRAYPDMTTQDTAWPLDGGIFTSNIFERTTIRFCDFFFLNDSDYTVQEPSNSELRILIHHQELHNEISESDLINPNPIAKPNILVSRINARNIALNPKSTIIGDNGVTPLDAHGFPQRFSCSQTLDTWLGFFEQDPVLERHVLCDFFDRNHSFRIGAFADLPFRAGAISTRDFNADSTARNYLGQASSEFTRPLVAMDASLNDYVRWFKQPAVLRCIEAHSNAFSSRFNVSNNILELEREVGGRPFRWLKENNEYIPSLSGREMFADFYIHRTMWTNRVLQNSGANLIIHKGCEVNWTDGTQRLAFYQQGYANWQNAEGLLFYMNGLALISRSKIYNDLPIGYPRVYSLNPCARFGDGWRMYFDVTSNDQTLNTFEKTIDSKKAYSWSMIGDWTVRLKYRGGIGILGFTPQFRALHIQSDRTTIDEWNFDLSNNRLIATGDLDGDGYAEMIITNDQCIGIHKHDGHCWRQLAIIQNFSWFNEQSNSSQFEFLYSRVGKYKQGRKQEVLIHNLNGLSILSLEGNSLELRVSLPDRSRFGDWHFDARNSKVIDVGDIDGNGLNEIIVISVWGVCLLGVSGDNFISLGSIQNGARIGGWLLNTADNKFEALRDIDGDGKNEILISSSWGTGIFKFDESSLHPLCTFRNGTRLGGWLLNTVDNIFGPVGDFDGDGLAEILISSPWGIGIFKFESTSLIPLFTAANGTRFDGWLLNTSDNIFGPVGDFDGNGCEEIVIRSPWGFAIIGLQGSNIHCLTMHANGTHIGDWILANNDQIEFANVFFESNKKQLLIKKRIP